MFRKTSILKQNEWSRYPRFAKHKMQFHSTKRNFTSHHSTAQHVQLATSIIAMARFVEFDVNRMDKANADLYRQAIEIKKTATKMRFEFADMQMSGHD